MLLDEITLDAFMIGTEATPRAPVQEPVRGPAERDPEPRRPPARDPAPSEPPRNDPPASPPDRPGDPPVVIEDPPAPGAKPDVIG